MTNGSSRRSTPISGSHSVLLPRWYKADGFLGANENAALLKLALSSEPHFVPTTVATSDNERQDGSHRSSRKLQSSSVDWKTGFKESVAAIFDTAAKNVGMKRESWDSIELEMVAHNDGDRFGRHIDTLHYNSGAELRTSRVLSAVYYFFEEPKRFTGGELRIHPFAGSQKGLDAIDIVPQNNLLVCFPSFAPHEVLKISCPSRAFRDSRFSINCWFHRHLS